MNLNFHIKNYSFILIVAICGFSFSQNNTDLKQNNQKLGFGSIDYSMAIPTGDNFVGLGMEGKGGFNIKAQFFIYKHFFIAGTVGSNYFSVKDKTIVGNYNKTTVSHQYLNIGYELLPLPNTRLGLSISLFGESNFENKSNTNNNESFQIDKGRIRSYELYFDYMISDEFAVYLNYAYRNDKMDIQTPPEIQNLFENTNFHTVSIGVKLYFGNKDLVSGI
tara:strand:- start:230 stop:889 length:660 start_codon:yes stop_codon:yes gene_type:complete